MKKTPDYILLILSMAVIIFSAHILLRPVKKTAPGVFKELPTVEEIFGKKVSVTHSLSEKNWMEVNAGGKKVGAVVLSSPHSDHITGYAGATPLVIAVDNDWRILKVAMLDNQETPAFAEKVVASGLLDRWKGLHWKEAAKVPFDGVTGATLTSMSVHNTFIHRLSLLESGGNPTPVETKPAFSWKDIAVILIALSGLYLCITGGKHHKNLRLIQLALSVVFLGFLTGSAFSLALMKGWITGGLPRTGLSGILAVALLAIIVPIITGKNYYCFFVCPFGAFQELINKVFPNQWKIGKKLDGLFRYIPYAVLTIGASAMILGAGYDPGEMEPFSAFMFRAAAPASIVIALVSLVLASGLKRPWCSYGCGAGAFLNLMRRPLDNKNKTCPGQPDEPDGIKPGRSDNV